MDCEKKTICEEAEKEKYDYVTGRFLSCCRSFNEFELGCRYWLEYIGNDTYVGRSDSILNKKFHITPKQLYMCFVECDNQEYATPVIHLPNRVKEAICSGFHRRLSHS